MMDDAIKMGQIHKNCNGLAGQPQLKALSAILQHPTPDHNPQLKPYPFLERKKGVNPYRFKAILQHPTPDHNPQLK